MGVKMSRGRRTLLFMTVPSILLVLVFSYLPIFGWVYTFFDYRIGYRLLNCEFVGLDNLIYAFSDPYIMTVILNTLIISVLGPSSSARRRSKYKISAHLPCKRACQQRVL